jgi:urease beta subunit
MIQHIELNPNKTYATRENAVNLRYILSVNADGRFFPVFLGERALQAGVHFHFCVAN